MPRERAYAYNEDECSISLTGNWEATNTDMPARSVDVTMYMLPMPEWKDREFVWQYVFVCKEGEFNFSNGETYTLMGMYYPFRSDNIDCIDTHEDLEVWQWSFKLEPGTYKFAEPGGLNDISVLTSTYGSYRHADGYKDAEEVVLEEGDHIRLYCLLGEYEWRDDVANLGKLMSYAEKREDVIARSYGTVRDETEDAEADVTIPVEVDAEPEVTVEEEETSLITEEENLVEPTAELIEEQPGSGIWTVVKCGLVLAVLVGLWFVKKNKADKDKD